MPTGRMVQVLSCVAALLLAAPGLSQSQRDLQDRVVYRDLRGPNDPVTLVAVLVDGQKVPVSTLGQPAAFQADDDWLKKLAVVLTNNTTKRITSALLFIDFPDTAHPSNPGSIGYFVRLGPLPDIDGARRRSLPAEQEHPTPLGFEAGRVFMVRLEGHYGKIQQVIEARQPIASIRSCKVHLHAFYFADGTRWMTRQYQRPDPNDQSIFIPMSEVEIRGLLSR